jgi:hypothetical protein
MSVWFVTPAWQRYELSAVCFAQRRHVIETLRQAGVEAHCVVIADDENLDLARAEGFAVVERDNSGLGRKFNDGMEYAGRHGAEWIVPIGSDSWVDSHYLYPLPDPRETRTSHMYCAVEADRLAELRVGRPSAAGPYMFHRTVFRTSAFRPAEDGIMKNVDSSTIRGLGRPVRWRYRDLHPFQYVGFRGEPHLTDYSRLMERWGVAEYDDPWSLLSDIYPVDLVERARSVLSLAVAA